MDVKVCNYHDVLLRYSDCLILQGNEWLNDQVVAFYLEYLRQEAFPDIRQSMLMLDPSTAFMLTSIPPESAPLLLDALGAPTKLMVVVPINNNTNAEQAGGSHWSLLCYLRVAPAAASAAADACVSSRDTSAGDGDLSEGPGTPDATPPDHIEDRQASTDGCGERGDDGGQVASAFVHIDSCRGSNDAAARRYLPALRQLVGDDSARMHVAETPQQSNGYDCGMFALEAAERLGDLAAAITASGSEGDPATAPHARGAQGLVRAVEAVMADMSQPNVSAKRDTVLELIRERALPSALLP